MDFADNADQFLIVGSVVLGGLLITLLVVQMVASRKPREPEPEIPTGAIDTAGEAFPTPPLPGQTFEYTPRSRVTIEQVKTPDDKSSSSKELPGSDRDNEVSDG